ncbi:hypothetical protein [Nocardioides sp.]|uniref:hypothetical protein n=1 Tax=Nocardioides sp. TaxID=35761 RepID=UPI002B27009F|nr:hypothetical protein [Nocardioides sp.]
MHTPGSGGSATGDDPVEMRMVPTDVGRASRGWDEQHHDLRAAAAQVDQAPVTGFPPRVERAAADFVRAWGDHVGRAADLSAEQADALRSVMAAWVHTDEVIGADFLLLLPYLEQLR